MVGSVGYRNSQGGAEAHTVFCSLDSNPVVTISHHVPHLSCKNVTRPLFYRAERNAMASTTSHPTTTKEATAPVVMRSTTTARNGIFGCRDEAPKIVIQTRERRQRPKSGK